jgi:hypothetical protein
MRRRPERREEGIMRIHVACIVGALALVCAGSARAGDGEDVTKLPGYVDFGTVALFGHKEADVEVLLEQNLINMVRDFSKSSDPDLAEMLGKLKQIRVQTFAIEPDKLEAIEKKTDEVSRRLEGQGWSPMVKVRKRAGGEQTYVYMKTQDGRIQGMVVMNVDPTDEASFINIVGEIDPEQIGKLSHKFNLTGMDSVKVRAMHGSSSDDEKQDKEKDKDK